ncbi:MAG: GAF domain-containing protein [Anaerolineales bacterium]|nr:GAF domain-containing protein [Anaerolineales bacterium]
MNEIQTKLEGYRRLIEISRDLASTLDLDMLLNRIIRAAVEISDAVAASILLYDDAAQELYFQVATNLDQQTMRGLAVPLEGSIAGWTVTNRKPVRISNVQDDPRYFSRIEQRTQFTTNSIMAVPLITQDKVVGVLEVLNKCDGEFTAADEDLLLVLGAQAAVAIVNARLFAQSDLISEFVHELRTPLASIGTATYLLQRPEISQEQREQMLQNIHDETQRLTTLATAFLDLARLESGRVKFTFKLFDLEPLLVECRTIMQGKADENRVGITIEVPADFPQISCDRDKMKQVVLNMLSNAIKYNRPRGKVILRVGQGEGEWTLAVEDNGVGIPEEAMPCLFQKFYRVRANEARVVGTGLGLSICKQIVNGHGGRIEVVSSFGKGTVFTLHFPRK